MTATERPSREMTLPMLSVAICRMRSALASISSNRQRHAGDLAAGSANGEIAKSDIEACTKASSERAALAFLLNVELKG